MKMNFPAPYACLRKQGQLMAKGQRPGLLPKIAKTSASPSTRDQTEDVNATADVMTAEQLIIRAKLRSKRPQRKHQPKRRLIMIIAFRKD
jgi:hypothetical protein